MNLKKQLGLSLVAGGGLLFGLSTTQTTAHASTYLRYYENIPNKTVSVTNKNAYVYNNGRLSRKIGTMRYYGSKVEEYYAAHVVKNGKASIYYKFRVGHRTGWVWHGYLKSIASSAGTTPTGTTNNSGSSTTSQDDKLQAESAAQDKQLLALFPNSVQDPTLMKVANGLENDPSLLIDDEANQKEDDLNRINSPLTSQQQAQLLTIQTSDVLSPLKTQLQSGQLSWGDYIKQDIARSYVQVQQTTRPSRENNYSGTPNKYADSKYCNPSNFPTLYAGWKVGVGSFPKDGDQDESSYGSYTVLLLPPDAQ